MAVSYYGHFFRTGAIESINYLLTLNANLIFSEFLLNCYLVEEAAMFYDLFHTFDLVASIVHVAAITCPAGLIVALHFMSERKSKTYKIDYDPTLGKGSEEEGQPSTVFANFMVLMGLVVSAVSFFYLGWPVEARQHVHAGWQFLQNLTGNP